MRDYDRFAEHFDATRKNPWKEVIDYFGDLSESSTVLDIGCGNGRHLAAAEKCGLNAVGLDISKNLLKIAKRKAHIPLVIGDALRLPFKDCAFDNSICVAVVHHFKAEKEREKCMDEIARITQKTGLVSVWALEQEKFAARKTQDIQLGWDKKHPRFYHLFREGELENLAQNVRVKIEKSFRSGNNYWAVVEH